MYWEPERSATIKIGKDEYPILLTLRATKEIAKKYGGLNELAEIVFSDQWEAAIDDMLWLIALLANQCIAIRNLYEKSHDPMLKPEDMEQLISPFDIPTYSLAIMQCLQAGSKRHVESEETDSKN